MRKGIHLSNEPFITANDCYQYDNFQFYDLILLKYLCVMIKFKLWIKLRYDLKR